MNKWIWMVGFCLSIASCQVNKYLQPEDQIFGEAKIELTNEEKFPRPARVRNELHELVQTKSNSNFGLWAHYALRNPKKEKGLRNKLSHKLGEEPAFYSETEMYRSSLLMQKYLSDLGHFHNQVTFDTTEGINRVDVVFRVSSEGRAKVGDFSLPQDSGKIATIVRRDSTESNIKPGSYYSLSNLVAERERVATTAQNEGYFDFAAEDIFYFVDTNSFSPAEPDVDIWLKIKPPHYGGDYRRYHIGHSYVYPNFDLSRAASIVLSDTVHHDDLTIYQNTEIIKPRTLSRTIIQSEGDVYSAERQRATSNHLLDLGIYKFVNIKYRSRFNDTATLLDRYIYLTPGDVQRAGLEVGGTTRPGFYGLNARTSYTHKNIFHGAEQLDLSVSGGFEDGGRFLVGDDTIRNNLVEFTARAELSFPRFVVPFVRIKPSSAFHIPRTRISLLANFQRRRRLFTLTNLRASLGYDWEETRRKRHQVKLVSINLVDLSNTTEAFDRYLDQNPVLARSFSDQFILGPSYTYTYTNQEVNKRQNYFFFLGQLETSGNLSYLVSRTFSGKSSTPYKIFNTQYSQFSKLDFDLRYNWVRAHSSLVLRFSPGLGIPYLNSDVLPYVRQYYLGGANSLRGFPIRGVLGSFRADPDNDVAQSAFDHTGEMKLEFNAEYRFDFWRQFYLKGAFFLDVGNVWLLDPQTLETDRRKVFHTNRFLSEMAIGSGAGLRFDIQFVVIRFDVAIPIRKPYLPAGERWTFSRMTQSGWLRDNMVFNIAIGYPF